QVFQHLVRQLRRRAQLAQAQAPVARFTLEPQQLDLELGTPRARLLGEEISGAATKRGRDRRHETELRLDLPVLELRQVRRRPSDLSAEFRQRQPCSAPGLTHTPTEHQRIEIAHRNVPSSFEWSQFWRFF